MLLMKTLNSVGISTDPWGMLFPISVCVDWCPFTLTIIDLLCSLVANRVYIPWIVQDHESVINTAMAGDVGLLFFGDYKKFKWDPLLYFSKDNCCQESNQQIQ